MKSFQTYSEKMLPAIEEQLKSTLNAYNDPKYKELYTILKYHMGWEGDGAGVKAQGKRIRPLLLLLSAEATGADWHTYLPLAAAIELVHNFSLLHDDIEDNSDLRRGRQTAWKKWGIPQALNAGDLLYTIANVSFLQNSNGLSEALLLKAAVQLHNTCIRLTQGQYLDMDFESIDDVALEDYWAMIEGKTAALIATSIAVGALQADDTVQQQMHEFGRCIGLAFQIQDDILGLWGDTAVTGKSNASDLISRKKSFPILYGLQNNLDFRNIWFTTPVFSNEAATTASDLLRTDGTYAYARKQVTDHTQCALASLKETRLKNSAIDALEQFAAQLLTRDN